MFLNLFDLLICEDIEGIFQIQGKAIGTTILKLVLGRLRYWLIGSRGIRALLFRVNRVYD